MNLDDLIRSCPFDQEHQPVLVREVLEAFSAFQKYGSPTYFDATFGRGGHYLALNRLIPQLQATAMDQDDEAITKANKKFSTEVELGKLRIVHANFSEFNAQEFGKFDMMLLDLGVSSPQLDTADRGFSFYHDGPLDMRMNRNEKLTAEYVVNTASEEKLVEIFRDYGEVQRPWRVARAIVHDRKMKAFRTTRELASLIERVEGWRKRGVHPATQYFMALRLVVNRELEVLSEALPKMMEALQPHGRLAVITFHSLEDRIVKNFFRQSHLGSPVNKKVITPSDEECRTNPRSRSAKLRVFERKVQDEPRSQNSC